MANMVVLGVVATCQWQRDNYLAWPDSVRYLNWDQMEVQVFTTTATLDVGKPACVDGLLDTFDVTPMHAPDGRFGGAISCSGRIDVVNPGRRARSVFPSQSVEFSEAPVA
ncbi:hypothetical protein J3458_005736 [Metarhizium acridum]|uniref:uncharacterized protein n=1 Tax=Metarhizium acridum TaxID=92637 RepID=UPI001C6B62F9|nr:hypothetical protein J3458_005736 [Metarhizium acridum]